MYVSQVSRGLVLFAAFAFCGCGGGTPDNLPTANIDASSTADPPTQPTSEVTTVPQLSGETDSAASVAPPVDLFPEVTISTTLGNIRVRLNGEKAPETVDNFLYNYVDRSFYEGTIFHFVQGDFIAIAGGFDAELNPQEVRPPIRNEADNGLKNVRGTIAMSRELEYSDSATSQFYFNLADNAMLDQTDAEKSETFGYCVFGEVIEGQDVLDKIAKVKVRDVGDFSNVPVEPIVIQSVQRDK